MSKSGLTETPPVTPDWNDDLHKNAHHHHDDSGSVFAHLEKQPKHMPTKIEV
eukprot:CAMPEP_0183606476 /NCGR_PEP_ID=MMETSP0371-20130417/182974_1 /TAXON_ID=268820 /ORGANISM="Peridinium aciculiferum, Strain PAER-2" /LENGTH=51 /DNA_ID=CAMNT_0025818591 /DNA_START=2178 /DNA_END=2334 /DNA_ORIENTATION=-